MRQVDAGRHHSTAWDWAFCSGAAVQPQPAVLSSTELRMFSPGVNQAT